MYRRYQKGDSAYWIDKRADIEKISIPTYITASYTNFVHTMGFIRGYLQVKTSNKWLRICPWQEWYDMWNCPSSANELAVFEQQFSDSQTIPFPTSKKTTPFHAQSIAKPISLLETDLHSRLHPATKLSPTILKKIPRLCFLYLQL